MHPQRLYCGPCFIIIILMKIVKKQDNRYLIVLKRGEEFIDRLTAWARENKAGSAAFTAIGACGKASLSWYNLPRKTYEDHEIGEDMEIAGITGNIALLNGLPLIHAHGIFARRDLSTVAGHIKSMTVSATCEISLTVFEGKMERNPDEETGLNLL